MRKKNGCITNKDLSFIKRLIPQDFYARDTVRVAQELLGTLLIREVNGLTIVGRIVETEAYIGDDPACHAYANHQRAKLGKTPTGRSAILFGEPGISYVYLNYGMYHLFNIVTEEVGVPGAVLIRALEPVRGIATMQSLRPQAKTLTSVANGPGKLGLAMSIGPAFNGHPVFVPRELYVAYADKKIAPKQIMARPRVGISKAKDALWRFYEKGSAFVSKA